MGILRVVALAARMSVMFVLITILATPAVEGRNTPGKQVPSPDLTFHPRE